MHEAQAPRNVRPSATDISNEVVRLHRQYLGKGPTQAKTYLERDAIFCVLRDGATSFEQTLQAGGRGGLARRARLDILENTARDAFRAKLSELCGREVDAVVCGHCPESEITTFAFLLGRPL